MTDENRSHLIFAPLLFGKDLFGLSKKTVRNYVAKKTHEIPKSEDYSDTSGDKESSLECLDHDGLGILFWFKYEQLFSMEWCYFFEPDEETIIWP